MADRMMDIGRIATARSTATHPAERISFAVVNELGMRFEVAGRPSLVKRRGFLCLHPLDESVCASLAEKTQGDRLVCTDGQLLAYCAKALKAGDWGKFKVGRITLPSAYAAEGLLKDCGVPVPPKGVAKGEPLSIPLDDPRLRAFSRKAEAREARLDG